jgi:peptide/nickel transport system permease protein
MRTGFLRLLGRRLAMLPLLLLGVTLVSFGLIVVVPGDPVAAALGEGGSDDPEVVATYRQLHGLDQPLPVQYIRYLGGVLQGDLGVSLRTQRPVRADLARFVPATLELAVVAIALTLVIGIGAGLTAAMCHDRGPDQIIRVLSLLGVSVPGFWLALVALSFLSFRFGIFPGIGRLDPRLIPPATVTGAYTIDSLLAGDWDTFRDALAHLLLPALVLAAYAAGLLTRFTRAAVLDVLGEDYVRMAWAKGLPGRVVVLDHVLRAALPSVITVSGVLFGNVLSGAVLTETIFAWPGLGQYTYLSATHLDLPAIVGVSLFVAVVYVTINFAVDVLYGVIDPRIRAA